MRGRWRRGLAVAWIAALAGCAGSGADRPAPGPVQRSVAGPAAARDAPVDPAYASLAGWRDDGQAAALAAFRKSCSRLLRQPTQYPVGRDGIAGRIGDWAGPCQAADAVEATDAAARAFFERWFEPLPANGADDGLFTGYYEPVLKGSWRRTAKFSVPLYRAPGKLRRMPTRAQIERGALARRGLELLWVDDPIDAFFLEIQGSGRVHMADGSVVGVEYAGQNGHPYFPVGRALVRWGELDADGMSMAAIREWMRRNPSRVRSLTALNRSHVFFRVREIEEARGAMGIRLTAGRSLAVDPRYLPLGAPVWLDLAGAPTGDSRLRRLVVAQDTGGAIKGPARGDLFWGVGDEAAAAAGPMRARGRAWLLVPRERTAGVTAAR
ncbi:MAG: MltA domain-containing protein [Alphaproteobacteria bacterium]|nr:MltA domain-containing protein [Alphaproteobacteria bacterium]